MVEINADIDNWIELAKQCKYLPEADLKVKKLVQVTCDLSVQVFYLCGELGIFGQTLFKALHLKKISIHNNSGQMDGATL